MDAYVCFKSNVPDRLYRVNYPGSQTAFSRTTGFSASDTSKVYDNNELVEFKQAIEDQFTWSSRASSPFISLFSDREHAENWGCKEPWRGHEGPSNDWSLHVIDTTRLKDTNRFFKLKQLLEDLEVKIPDRACQHIGGAFLCLHRIPIQAIIEERNPEEVKKGKRKEQSVEFDYLAEYSGSEQEGMEENYSTIFEKNIENNW
ncbi:hypothetical protein K505DRAFT_351430 [Melanomma pulvis-pyrius CBS 109.77]|uniref:DUF7587 domain-containing protein n=1 Tax=Melanomma pulvis-pyrius CBS 109.77 TaxID=1314802 RepID=A0A6A6X4I7_9PLEO|nr:hypothetical protein K505DRAFT_351430 [Melanomma pulvis-pyrius CBS 109.77]